MSKLPNQLPPQQRWDRRYAGLSPAGLGQPTPFVTACLPQLPAHGRALDIAAGAGRHTNALAQHGLQVDAVDISRYGLYRARQRARLAGLAPEAQINFIVADVECPWLPQQAYDVILVAFFLFRPLFPLIKDRLLPRGWLVYESFLFQEDDRPTRPTVRPEFQLQPGELKSKFSNFEILFYDEGDHNGRLTAQLLARKINDEH